MFHSILIDTARVFRYNQSSRKEVFALNYHIITEPLVGAIIGYITNAIAIKMLFRPANPVYIKGHRVPFTPGLIPKEKSRLAEAVGKAVGESLLAADTVTAALLSERMTEKIAAGIDDLFEKVLQKPETLENEIQQRAGEETYAQTRDKWENDLADLLAQKLSEADVGAMASRGATDYAKAKSPALLTGLVQGLLDDRIKHSIQNQIRDAVNDYVKNNARGALYSAIHNESEKLLNTPVCDLAGEYRDKLPALKEKALDLYRDAISSGTEKVLASIDLAAIVREKIESFDNAEIERMVFQIANTELKAIVWLGAALGCLMGLINLLIP